MNKDLRTTHTHKGKDKTRHPGARTHFERFVKYWVGSSSSSSFAPALALERAEAAAEAGGAAAAALALAASFSAFFFAAASAFSWIDRSIDRCLSVLCFGP